MVQVALYQPEIPPNTGNIIRLCANSGCPLHLIGPLGFSLDDRYLRRAGMDYRDLATVQLHESLDDLLKAVQHGRLYAISTKGTRPHTSPRYRPDDLLLFGAETRGLPDRVRDSVGADHVLRIPMVSGNRSLNLANAVAIVVYEAWRQRGFEGAERSRSRQ